MRPRTSVPLLLLTLIGSAACSSARDDAGPGAASVDCSAVTGENEKLECRMLELVNQVRAEGAACGGTPQPVVAALAMHPILQQTARAHAADMAQNDYFAHESLDNRTPFDRMQQAGYDFSTAAENIAAGSATAEATLEQWMKSPGHCQNILRSKFVHIGVGYAFSANHQYRHVWVQNFASP
jgi:uncharacterized protein YkwD